LQAGPDTWGHQAFIWRWWLHVAAAAPCAQVWHRLCWPLLLPHTPPSSLPANPSVHIFCSPRCKRCAVSWQSSRVPSPPQHNPPPPPPPPQVQALRSVEKYLGLEQLYVLGTNCTDNGPRQGLEKFLKAASTTPGGWVAGVWRVPVGLKCVHHENMCFLISLCPCSSPAQMSPSFTVRIPCRPALACLVPRDGCAGSLFSTHRATNYALAVCDWCCTCARLLSAFRVTGRRPCVCAARGSRACVFHVRARASPVLVQPPGGYITTRISWDANHSSPPPCLHPAVPPQPLHPPDTALHYELIHPPDGSALPLPAPLPPPPAPIPLLSPPPPFPPDTALHYEFMQDYRVHIKHTDGRYETIPYFCLPAKELNDVIAPSCYSCFDYPNALADLVVGYMGVPYTGGWGGGECGGGGGGGGGGPGGTGCGVQWARKAAPGTSPVVTWLAPPGLR
jgi:hypothetical protein